MQELHSMHLSAPKSMSLTAFLDDHRHHVLVVEVEGFLGLSLADDVGVILVLDELFDLLDILAFPVCGDDEIGRASCRERVLPTV